MIGTMVRRMVTFYMLLQIIFSCELALTMGHRADETRALCWGLVRFDVPSQVGFKVEGSSARCHGAVITALVLAMNMITRSIGKLFGRANV
jgi:hypothetical protein